MENEILYEKKVSNWSERAKLGLENDQVWQAYKMPDKFKHTNRIEKLFKSINRKYKNKLYNKQPDEKFLRAECGIFDVKFKTACRIGGWKY